MGTDHPSPARDFAGYLESYVDQMAFGDEDPAVIVDRYHTPGIVWVSDGIRLDREKLVAHARPVRRNMTACRVDVAETLVTGDRIAARYTLSAATRKGRETVTEVYLFGRLAPDGRLRHIDQITRTP
ncbi:nuclear transport factor 2 family protein [Amycolatopsis sp. NPDC059021]|uniref:nuclear transport factor 2 family protein n=1 Tax=Amycolatopsis sp. NPDC059021 TaxID=3346704 RepID=UPI0036722ACE